MMREYIKRINDTETEKVIASLLRMKRDVQDLSHTFSIYNNRMVCDMLNISENQLNRYRCDGLLDYSRCGDKYWYIQDDIDNFLNRIKNDKI